ncbi:MAG: hypothetical protein RMJ44_00740 [Cytophagales bacterium]|nr:hypothetical protein [Bernardetiaceae bacterium]MDW8209586.1 hypothetical protein [Cytophagales bacterium]
MNDFIRNLASDLLRLEINTIIKQNMSAEKIPSNKRVLLRKLADMYRETLIDYGIAKSADDPQLTAADAPKVLRWQFGGEFSFKEIALMASKGIEQLEQAIKNETDPLRLNVLNSRQKILQRICNQSYNVIGIFKLFRRDLAPDTLMQSNEHEEPAKQIHYVDKEHFNYLRYQRGELPLECIPFRSHQETAHWNNDLDWMHLNAADDLPFLPDMLAMIYKAYQIGTEQIVLQTVIQVEGDITSYITPQYINMPDNIKEVVMNVHNRAISLSTQFWNTLFSTVMNLAGKSFNQIFTRNRK